ncbi:MAG TPA: proton-conducting transporter membrane subunit, partial [Desulfurivibrionaceae bacterium]|nr:proton-conducting transporter membrane subunit [Desulfurivibrionaceae bacterium]
METIVSIKPLLALLVALAGSVMVMLSGKKPNIREGWSFVAAVTMFGIIASMIPTILPAPLGLGKKIILPLFKILPGLSVTLRVDAFSMIFAVVASFLWILAVFYSAGYMRGLHEHAQTRFNACFALALFGAIGVAFSDNLFTMYLFYEIVSIGTYPLVAHHQDAEGYEGAKKYIVYLTTTAKGLVLPAMILIYVLTGTLDFADNINTGIFPAGVVDAQGLLVTVLYVFCLLGFAKNGVMPFHNWLPGAMVAPTPVSALLHAVAVVKVGVFS